MEGVALEVESCHLPLGHLDALWIGVGVEFTADGQAGLGRGTGDQGDYGEAAGERRCAPVLRDVTEQAVLDLVPLRGAGRRMADLKTQAGLVGKPLQLNSPKPQTRPV